MTNESQIPLPIDLVMRARIGDFLRMPGRLDSGEPILLILAIGEEKVKKMNELLDNHASIIVEK